LQLCFLLAHVQVAASILLVDTRHNGHHTHGSKHTGVVA